MAPPQHPKAHSTYQSLDSASPIITLVAGTLADRERIVAYISLKPKMNFNNLVSPNNRGLPFTYGVDFARSHYPYSARCAGREINPSSPLESWKLSKYALSGTAISTTEIPPYTLYQLYFAEDSKRLPVGR
ncbi:uncharacterized protein PAC_00627 [Phialocephala subalpina]|uniref:Uncharacterized protein n=1 Tax=Phialocephala subalpina TaxID=576137 RepID=A0A1L7WD92_9HELO|nr:uncharacterized protein PAC_00627 [Phialocephala subalpina]